jgi:predicted dehydrogenase
MERRGFIQGAATGLTAASYARVAGANQRVRMALVGCGRRGRVVMKALLGTGAVDLVGLCDVYDKQRQEAAALAPSVTGTVALEEILCREDVDGVVIATPDHLHADQVTAALAAGKHVYVEKPTVHRPEEGERLLQALGKAKGLVLQTGTQQRSGAHYRRARELVAAGKLGTVAVARAMWSDFPNQHRTIAPLPKPAGLDWERFLGKAPRAAYTTARYETWRLFPDYGGGLLADILTHWADVAQWLLDDTQPLSAVATGGVYHHHDERKNPDVVNAIVQYRGWHLTFESSVLPLKTKAQVVLLGSAGTLEIDRSGYTFTPHGGKAEVVPAAGDLDAAHAADFLEAAQRGRPGSAPLERGLEALRPVQLALAAYWKQRRMKWASGRIVAA